MAQIPEFSALPPLAQAMVMQGYTFDVAIAAAAQQAQDAAAAAQGDAGVLVVTAKQPKPTYVDRRMGRTAGPGQLPQFTGLPANAQQHVIDRGMTFSNAQKIESEITTAPSPVISRQWHQNSD